MKASKRLTLVRLYGTLYTRMENVPLDTCWYCGSPRECLDHTPPLGYLEHMDINRFRERGGKFTLVPSCNTCNALLGNRKLLSPNEKISWLLGAYSRLFDRAYYGWSDDDIEEMGYNFRVMISHSISKASSYMAKVREIENRIIDIKEWDKAP